MNGRDLGLVIMALGVLALIVGAAVFTGLLGWFGRLPGDIRIEGETTRVYVPITSMLLVSVGFSLLLYVVRRFL